MSKKEKLPSTAAVRALKAAKVSFTPRPFAYEPKGGTAVSSRELGVDERQVIKTLIMEADDGAPLAILMHGDCQVSTKALARHMGVKGVAPCDPLVAERHTGYQVGGTSPFGMRRAMPIFAEASIRDLPRLFINGGGRGFLVEIAPAALEEVLGVEWVEVAIPRPAR